MKTKRKACMLLVLVLILLGNSALFAQRQTEYLNRGVVRMRVGSTNYISWRMLGHEPADVGYHVYRGSTRLTNTPLTNATFYTDTNGGSGDSYTIRAVINGQEQEASENSRNLNGNYWTVNLQIPPGSYTANDLSVGDLDGDGEYELVLKWDPTNAKDNSQSGVTDKVYLDAYELDGTRMWRIDLGINIRAGAHYTQFMVYDLDGDGSAEVACKTADGTRDGAGTVIGNAGADYRNSGGYILSGPEYLTVFEGKTGRILTTTNYLPGRGNVSSWGDNYGNRVDRFLAAIAYLDGSHPSLVMCRGYYTRTVLVAWDFRNGSLVHRWTFDSDRGYSSYAGQGYHSLSVGDVDNDGRDEIVYGSCAIDDNGQGLWNSRLGHGDALHLSDIDTSRPGLEVWGIHENAQIGSALLDARTGAIIWSTGSGDVGRGVAANVTDSHPGMECWGGTDGLRTAGNGSAGSSPSSANHVVWWDGDLERELLNGNVIDKYGSSRQLTASGCSSINGTKSNPNLQADLWGDWREEVIWRTDDNRQLRIYTTTASTNHRLYTLMHDPIYRLSIAWQNVAYNQPPHTGYFIGSGMAPIQQPSITYPGGTPETPPPTPTPTPMPPLGPGTHTLEAEDAYYPNAWVETEYPGYSGRGYVNTENATGAYIEWTIPTSTSGDAGCVFTFANGADSRPVEIIVNGTTVISSLDFPSTGAWENWDTTSLSLSLASGTNSLILRSLTSGGAPNLDKLELTLGGSAPPFRGDVNGDGKITIVDALMIAQAAVGLNPQGFIAGNADVNCDGNITIIDALVLAQFSVGVVSDLNC